MAYNDGVKVGPIAYIGLVSVIVTFVLVLMLQVIYYQQRNRMANAALAAAGRPQELVKTISEQQLALTQRGYVDRQQGVVAIGIERAKELVVQELAAGETPEVVNGPERAVPPATETTPPANEAEPASAEGGAESPADPDVPPVAEGAEQ